MGLEGGASLVGHNLSLTTETFDRPVDVTVKEPEQHEPERILISKHFLECIREAKEPITLAMRGLKNNLVLDAIFESSRTGHEMKLSLIEIFNFSFKIRKAD